MMSEMTDQKIEGIPNFWTRVLRAERRVLALDYDGTLAPFKIERMKAQPLPGTEELLTRIAGDRSTRLVVVSGRPVAELVKLLGPLRMEMVGAHGFELRDCDGHVRAFAPDRYQTEGLREAYLRAQDSSLRPKIERKIASIAFHSRGTVDEADRNELAQCLWTPIAVEYGLELRVFNGGVELRATGSNKGTAILELLLTEPDDALAVYIGDDETDEDAFQVIRTRGIGIKVGGYGIRTAAAGRVPNCEAVRDFLRSWYCLTRGS